MFLVRKIKFAGVAAVVLAVFAFAIPVNAAEPLPLPLFSPGGVRLADVDFGYARIEWDRATMGTPGGTTVAPDVDYMVCRKDGNLDAVPTDKSAVMCAVAMPDDCVIATSTPSNFYIDNEAVNGATYTYYILSHDKNGSRISGFSSSSRVAVQIPAPALPTPVIASVSAKDESGRPVVSVGWNLNGSEVAPSRYVLYRTVNNESLPKILPQDISVCSSGSSNLCATEVSAPANSTKDRTVGVNHSYKYYVQAFTQDGGRSFVSDGRAVKTVTAKTPPPAPRGVSVSAGDAEVSLSWNEVASALRYKLYRRAGTDFAKIDDEGVVLVSETEAVPSAAGPLIDSGLQNGATYFYRVSAVNDAGESAFSTPVSATPKARELTPPAAIAAAAVGTSVNVSWGDVPGAAGYRLYRAQDKDFSAASGDGVVLIVDTQTSQPADAPLADPDLIAGSTYYYRALAYSDTRESALSAVATATPFLPCVQNAPTITQGETDAVSRIFLTVTNNDSDTCGAVSPDYKNIKVSLTPDSADKTPYEALVSLSPGKSVDIYAELRGDLEAGIDTNFNAKTARMEKDGALSANQEANTETSIYYSPQLRMYAVSPVATTTWKTRANHSVEWQAVNMPIVSQDARVGIDLVATDGSGVAKTITQNARPETNGWGTYNFKLSKDINGEEIPAGNYDLKLYCYSWMSSSSCVYYDEGNAYVRNLTIEEGALVAPENLKIVSREVSATGTKEIIRLDWDAFAGATEYLVRRTTTDVSTAVSADSSGQDGFWQPVVDWWYGAPVEQTTPVENKETVTNSVTTTYFTEEVDKNKTHKYEVAAILTDGSQTDFSHAVTVEAEIAPVVTEEPAIEQPKAASLELSYASGPEQTSVELPREESVTIPFGTYTLSTAASETGVRVSSIDLNFNASVNQGFMNCMISSDTTQSESVLVTDPGVVSFAFNPPLQLPKIETAILSLFCGVSKDTPPGTYSFGLSSYSAGGAVNADTEESFSIIAADTEGVGVTFIAPLPIKVAPADRLSPDIPVTSAGFSRVFGEFAQTAQSVFGGNTTRALNSQPFTINNAGLIDIDGVSLGSISLSFPQSALSDGIRFEDSLPQLSMDIMSPDEVDTNGVRVWPTNDIDLPIGEKMILPAVIYFEASARAYGMATYENVLDSNFDVQIALNHPSLNKWRNIGLYQYEYETNESAGGPDASVGTGWTLISPFVDSVNGSITLNGKANVPTAGIIWAVMGEPVSQPVSISNFIDSLRRQAASMFGAPGNR